MAQSVVEVELAVPTQETCAAYGHDGVVHAAIAGNLLEHSGHDGHFERRGRLGKSGDKGPLECLGCCAELV